MGNGSRPAAQGAGSRARRPVQTAAAAALAVAGLLVLLLHGRLGGGAGGSSAAVRAVVGEAAPAAPRGTSWLRASATLTPGALNPAVTPATLSSTVCRKGWTRTVRPPVAYTSALKLRQLAAWHLPGGPRDYQEDHLISLELGGHPTDVHNLWPEPRPYAEQVDRLENELNRLVCTGAMPLAEAQQREARWKHERG